jgi:hypothetical protein
MNFLASIWPFRGRSYSNGADTDSDSARCEPAVEPAGVGDRTDSQPGEYGVGPDIDGVINWRAGSPSYFEEGTSEPEPTPTRWMPAEYQAELLIEALIDWRHGGNTLLSPQMRRCHETMCARIGFKPCHWNQVAAAFRKLTRQKKTYRWHRLVDGRRVRLAAFAVPKRMPHTMRLIVGEARR